MKTKEQIEERAEEIEVLLHAYKGRFRNSRLKLSWKEIQEDMKIINKLIIKLKVFEWVLED